MNEIFHVHTWRCGHAEDVSDEEYIKKAIELGADRITFTDHAPFPDDLFSGRMKIAQLPEYISSLLSLKDKYINNIDVKIGFEVEYLPSYTSYIVNLRNNKDIDILLLGQHFYEVFPSEWSFNLLNKNNEWEGLIEAQISGIESGLFDIVAHPDRIFRRCSCWSDNMNIKSQKLIDAAIKNNVILEKNFSSKKEKRYFWKKFWKLVPDVQYIKYGCDAHSLNDMKICNKENFDKI